MDQPATARAIGPLVQRRNGERGTLTEYSMRADRDPLAAAMNEHTYFSREATGGGSAVGGSSCGCN